MMRTLFRLPLVLCVLALLTASFPSRLHAASSSVAAFDEANKLYEQGRFGAAADAYETLLKKGETTLSVYFNLGNARFRNGEVGRAVAAYIQGRRLAPRDASVQSNLQLARRAVRGAEDFSSPIWQRVLGQLTGNEWAWATLAASCAFFLLLIWGERRPESRSRIRRALRLSGACLACCAMALLYVGGAEQRAVAVVVRKEAPVRFTPLDESPVAFNGSDGLELEVMGRKTGASATEEWLDVRDSAQRRGWIRRASVEIVGTL
ncbi:MAG: tetratricopeptide repeat protein [Verrucomicrobia bacterium]|nr:tetratricopeptide repeat protein [Verrucomicrobiota bacterium]MBI3867754.1 tetratricopeptide repeat protein [Verrucomicrobiota bacterium]